MLRKDRLAKDVGQDVRARVARLVDVDCLRRQRARRRLGRQLQGKILEDLEYPKSCAISYSRLANTHCQPQVTYLGKYRAQLDFMTPESIHY